jgi:hypothetical protein
MPYGIRIFLPGMCKWMKQSRFLQSLQMRSQDSVDAKPAPGMAAD